MPNIKQVLVGAAAVTLGVSFVAAVVSPNTDDSTSSSQETSVYDIAETSEPDVSETTASAETDDEDDLWVTETTVVSVSTDPAEETEDPGEAEEIKSTYILNTNSMVAHTENCRMAARISDSNKKEFKGASDELDKKGYKPCGICEPW